MPKIGTRHLDPPYRSALIGSAALNAIMFIVEGAMGLWSGSGALVADAADFLEDTGIYSLAVIAIGWSARGRSVTALAMGVAMCGVGFIAATQIAAHAYWGGYLAPLPMGATAVVALAVNMVCALRLAPFNRGDASMRSIWLSTRNDAILNATTIFAAGTVALTAAAWPDTLAGILIAGINTSAALTIITHADSEMRAQVKRR